MNSKNRKTYWCPECGWIGKTPLQLGGVFLRSIKDDLCCPACYEEGRGNFFVEEKELLEDD